MSILKAVTSPPRAFDVTLLRHEIDIATFLACARQADNLMAGLADAHGAEKGVKGWGLHILGACGEMAVAKHLNVYWNGALGNLKADDVGRYQVRTRSLHHYDLIVHESDGDDKIFILVTSMPPGFRVQGWTFGHMAKKKCYWKDPAGERPAFFFPRGNLYDMESLPR